MQKIGNLIERIFTKKNIKIVLLLFVVVWFFVWTSFAQSTTTWSSWLSLTQQFSKLMHIAISMLSWWWVILATLAWKFMTNDFVYGTFLHLDSSLWNLWNMMKNFANFTLWFILIFSIAKNLISVAKNNSSPLNESMKTVWKVLMAWVLVQMSWFLISVMLDLSTIGTAAIWALPSQFIVADTDFQGNMRQLLGNVQHQVIVDFSAEWDLVNIVKTGDLNSDFDVKKLVDTIMPSSNSMVWPLLFVWASVFNLYEISDTSKNTSGTDDWSELFLSLWINSFVLVAFSLMMAFIFIFNLFRLVTLWVIIPISPFIMLFSVFSIGGKSFDKLKSSDLWKILDYQNVIQLIFKPVYMTLVLSIVLIVMVLLRTLIKADWNLNLTEQNNLTVASKNIWTQEDKLYDSSLDIWDIANISLKLKDSLADILVYILWLALMFMLMKSCVSWKLTWISFIDDRINTLSKSIWGETWKFGWILWEIWVVPIGNEKVWINAMRKMKENVMNDWTAWARAVGIDISEQDSRISELLWKASFASLNLRMSRDEWINQAVLIWQRKHYTSAYNMQEKSDEFRNAMDKWNKYYKKDEDKIRIQDVDAVWNGEKPGKETKKEENKEGEVPA